MNKWQCWKEAFRVGVGAVALQLWGENKELKKQQVVQFEMQCDDDNIDQHKSHKIRTLQTKQIKKKNANEEKKQT